MKLVDMGKPRWRFCRIYYGEPHGSVIHRGCARKDRWRQTLCWTCRRWLRWACRPMLSGRGTGCLLRDRIVMQGEFSNIHLVTGDYVFDALIFFVMWINCKEYVIFGVCNFTENGYCCCFVAVTDIVFRSFGKIGAVRLGIELHFHRSRCPRRGLFRKDRMRKAGCLWVCSCLVLGFLKLSPRRTGSHCWNMEHIPVGWSVLFSSLRFL